MVIIADSIQDSPLWMDAKKFLAKAAGVVRCVPSADARNGPYFAGLSIQVLILLDQ